MRAIAALCLVVLSASGADADCLEYGPVVVTLTGSVTQLSRAASSPHSGTTPDLRLGGDGSVWLFSGGIVF